MCHIPHVPGTLKCQISEVSDVIVFLQVLRQGCTYKANSPESRWPRGRFTCFVRGTSRLWFFFWLSFLAGKLDPSISNSWFCWPFFAQWNNEIYYAVVKVNNSVSQSMMLPYFIILQEIFAFADRTSSCTKVLTDLDLGKVINYIRISIRIYDWLTIIQTWIA